MAGGRGLRTINHGSTFTTIEQREPSNISGPSSFFDETANSNNSNDNNQNSQNSFSQMNHQDSHNSNQSNNVNDTFSGIAPIDSGHGHRSHGIGFGSVARSNNNSNNNNNSSNSHSNNGSIWGNNRQSNPQPAPVKTYQSDAEKLNSMRNKNAVSSSDLWDDHKISNNNNEKDYIDNGTSCSSKYNTNMSSNSGGGGYNMSDMGDQIDDIKDAALEATTRLGSLLGSAVSSGMEKLRNSNY